MSGSLAGTNAHAKELAKSSSQEKKKEKDNLKES